MLFYSSKTFAQAQVSPAPPPTEISKRDTSHVTLWPHGSLMFDKQTSEWLNAAVKSFDQNIPLEILLPSLFPAIKPETKVEEIHQPESVIIKSNSPIEAPAFYLKSILYFSPDNWSLWLNNKKLSDNTDKTIENITLVDISHKQASFLWKNTTIDLIYPDWKDLFTAIEDNKYASPEKNILVDASTGNITFILKPNQSLVSKTLEIVEGPAKSSSLDKQATTTPDIAPNPVAVPTKQEPSREITTQAPVVNDPPKTELLEKKPINTLDALKNLMK